MNLEELKLSSWLLGYSQFQLVHPYQLDSVKSGAHIAKVWDGKISFKKRVLDFFKH
jgi:hypothetical protein